MIKLTINTYYHINYDLDSVYAAMPEDVAYNLFRLENKEVWKQLCDAARTCVPEEEREDIVHALQMTNQNVLKKYVIVDTDHVVCKGHIDDYAQTTLRYETPFLLNIEKFWADTKADWGETKTFTFGVVYQSYGKQSVEVPARIKTREEAMAWVKEHWSEIPLPSDADYVPESDQPDFENCELQA